MKKNVFLKVAAAMLVLCLASTCAIGTTFAKYTTADSASDTARVAKWGITVAVSGTLFGKDYAAATAGTDVANRITAATSQSVATASVAGVRDKNIVAPGTMNDTGFQVKITGTPEVQYKATAGLNSVTIEDIFLATGEWGVMVPVYGVNDATDISGYYTVSGTTYTLNGATAYDSAKTYYALHDYVNVTADYYPIAWTVTEIGTAPAITETHLVNADGTDGIAAKIADNLAAVAGNANDGINFGYTLTWEWEFSVDAATDAKDTILGNLMAADTTNKVVKKTGATYTSALTDGTDYNLEIAFGLNVTVDQVN